MDDYLDSPMDSDDVFPCKGCGEILEEGKAFELAGNRWHLNCFRCNTCGTLLDSDANLLLLGDGSLICNNCTYSCSACGNKIEDLAILTGDQAFCATCFRCRNCKRKIENLRYARTSQGIFCMNCHESLMARRRKKSKVAQQAKAREKESSSVITDKSLPALPPNAVPPNAFSNERVSPESGNPTELSPRPRPAYGRTDSSSRSSSRPDRSPERPSETRESGLSVPSKSYRNNRNSSIMSSSDVPGLDSDSFLIPVALDPSPAPSATPRSTSDNYGDAAKSKDKEYLPVSRPTEKVASTPHIAFQEKSRQPSTDYESPAPPLPARKLSKSSRSDKMSGRAEEKLAKGDGFKLQEAPKSKKLPKTDASQDGPSRKDSLPTTSLQSADKMGTPRSSQDSRLKEDDNKRPSIDNASLPPRIDSQKAISRKELPFGRNLNGKSIAPSKQGQEERTPQPPPTAGYQSLHSRPGISEQKLTDTYMQPRAPPAPPGATHTPKESVSSTNEPPSPKVSPKLPRWSAGGDFSMDEDMARILGTDEGSSSILRRVSNAVRHGRTNSSDVVVAAGRHGHARSASETTKSVPSPRWPKTPGEEHGNGHAQDISSPISLSSSDDPAFLKRQLRNSEQRVAELERQFKSEKDLKNLNKKLVEKRKTVSELDTQTELLVQQLEVLSGLVEKARTNQQAIDLRELEDSAIKDFMHRLDKLKHKFSIEFEQIVAARDEMEEQRNQAIADRDRALVEFEQLSTKNAQLADLNNDLTHQIQERFKAQIVADPKSPNGLGLGLVSQPRGTPSVAVLPDSASYQTSATGVSNDQEETVLEPGVAAVKISKGQVKKFNWKKGTSKTMQSVAKGVKGAVVAFQNQQQERNVPHGGIDISNIGMPYEATRVQLDSPISHTPNGQYNRQAIDQGRQGFGGFFKKTNTGLVPSPIPKSMSNANVAMPAADPSTTLFGSDLTERADYERRQIPCVVTRCIEEVELRGMDTEGIYRKTGGNSQVKMVQDGFDKSEDFDISDPSIDITAVTSVLKQYFRKLPIPLLTFDVYDRILESNSMTTDEDKIDHLKMTFDSLPQKHKDCLEFLMFHLARVAQREPENLMSSKNLAVVFAPTIMRDRSIEREMSDMHAKNLAVQFVIENSDKIFES